MSNDRIILDEILEQERTKRAPALSVSAFFELFTTEQILKDYDLSDEELESGLIGDGGDGGVDSIYVLVNGELVRDDYDVSHLRKDITLEFVMVQSKTSPGFAETPVERFITVSDDILDLGKPISALEHLYNPALVGAIDRFRTTYKALASKFPALRVNYVYACKGAKPDQNVTHKADKLIQMVHDRFPSAQVGVTFLGAKELLELARRSAKTTFTLPLAENPVSSAGEVGFVALVYLRDYFDFISDETKRLRRQMFEANVRDYQGRTEVNDAIQAALKDKNAEDFWWLNNGVTITASRASLSAKALTIEDPQVVNGLQTSSEICNYFVAANTADEGRKLLVRVIVPSDSASRDRIIKATNSQTAIQQASLRATDKIHRDIEEYLRPRGLFYDRRKNYYKNEGKPLDRVIGIPQLAQAVMAILLARPDQARARPSSLLKDDKDYAQVYNASYPIDLYYVAAETIKRVEAYLRSDAGLDARDRNNLRFYVAMHAIYTLAGKWRPHPVEIAVIEVQDLTRDHLARSVESLRSRYAALGGDDRAAKGSEFVRKIEEDFGGSEG